LAPDYPHNSPYAFSENRVIDAVELEGLEMYPAYAVTQILSQGHVKTGLSTADIVLKYQYNPDCPKCNVNNPYVLNSIMRGGGGIVTEQDVNDVDEATMGFVSLFIPIPYAGALSKLVGNGLKWTYTGFKASPAALKAAEIFATKYGVTRGVALEGLAALNKYKGWNWAQKVASNFPTFDFYKDGVFASFKTWNAKSFSLSSYKGFINKIAENVNAGSLTFKGKSYTIDKGVLDILVPEGLIDDFLKEGGKYYKSFQKLLQYGKDNNVIVKIGTKVD
jgi:hypothetical protein